MYSDWQERNAIYRSNAQHSTGPITEEGKQRSRMNAYRHGLTGQVSVMNEEDRIAYDDFTQPFIAELKPVGVVELQHAQLIAQGHWRLNRIAALEECIFRLGSGREETNHEGSGHYQTDTAFTEAEVFRYDDKKLALLSLYESRISSGIRRNTKRLEELQATRKAEEAKAREEAELLAELAEHEGRDFDPQQFGFVFSIAEIKTWLERRQLLERARALRNSRKQPLPKAA